MNLNNEPCIRSIDRLYCYLRLNGLEPQTACRELQRLLPETLATDVGINVCELIRAGRVNVILPEPSAAPPMVRGHIGYPALTD